MEILGLGGGKPPVIPIPILQHAGSIQTFIVTNYNPKYTWNATVTSGTVTTTVLSSTTLQINLNTSDTTLTVTSSYRRAQTKTYASLVSKTYTFVPGPDVCTGGECQATCGCCNCFNGSVCTNEAGTCTFCNSAACPNGLCFAGAASPCTDNGCICCTPASCVPGPSVPNLNTVTGYTIFGSPTYGELGEWYKLSDSPITSISPSINSFSVHSYILNGVLDIYIKLPNEYGLLDPLLEPYGTMIIEFYDMNNNLVQVVSNGPDTIVTPIYRFDHQYLLHRETKDHSWYIPNSIKYSYTIITLDDTLITGEGVVS